MYKIKKRLWARAVSVWPVAAGLVFAAAGTALPFAADAAVVGQNVAAQVVTAPPAITTVVSNLGKPAFVVPGGTYYAGMVVAAGSYAAHAGGGVAFIMKCSARPDHYDADPVMGGAIWDLTDPRVSTTTVPGGVLLYAKVDDDCPASYPYLSVDAFAPGRVSDLSCPADQEPFRTRWEGYVDQAGNCMGGVADTASELIGFLGGDPLAAAQYRFGGFLPPVKADGSGIYKRGRTLPVKFRLADVGDGSSVPDAVAHLSLANISAAIAGSEEVAVSTPAADDGDLFRYDPASDGYIFNLDTEPLTTGTWRLTAALDDGMAYGVNISVK